VANLTESDIAAAAQALYQAELDNEPITPISETYPTADISDAYAISQAVTDL
jgi:2-keto-4-pentenoate hydratase